MCSYVCNIEWRNPDPSIHSVSVTGDFDGWRGSTTASRSNDNAFHQVILVKEPAITQFKFILNGKDWVVSDQYEIVIDANGNQNNVIGAELFHIEQYLESGKLESHPATDEKETVAGKIAQHDQERNPCCAYASIKKGEKIGPGYTPTVMSANHLNMIDLPNASTPDDGPAMAENAPVTPKQQISQGFDSSAMKGLYELASTTKGLGIGKNQNSEVDGILPLLGDELHGDFNANFDASFISQDLKRPLQFKLDEERRCWLDSFIPVESLKTQQTDSLLSREFSDESMIDTQPSSAPLADDSSEPVGSTERVATRGQYWSLESPPNVNLKLANPLLDGVETHADLDSVTLLYSADVHANTPAALFQGDISDSSDEYNGRNVHDFDTVMPGLISGDSSRTHQWRASIGENRKEMERIRENPKLASDTNHNHVEESSSINGNVAEKDNLDTEPLAQTDGNATNDDDESEETGFDVSALGLPEFAHLSLQNSFPSPSAQVRKDFLCWSLEDFNTASGSEPEFETEFEARDLSHEDIVLECQLSGIETSHGGNVKSNHILGLPADFRLMAHSYSGRSSRLNTDLFATPGSSIYKSEELFLGCPGLAAGNVSNRSDPGEVTLPPQNCNVHATTSMNCDSPSPTPSIPVRKPRRFELMTSKIRNLFGI